MTNDEMFQHVCELIHTNGNLDKADWQRIFMDALDNAFGNPSNE